LSQFWAGACAWKGKAKQKPNCGKCFEKGLRVEKLLLFKEVEGGIKNKCMGIIEKIRHFLTSTISFA